MPYRVFRILEAPKVYSIVRIWLNIAGEQMLRHHVYGVTGGDDGKQSTADCGAQRSLCISLIPKEIRSQLKLELGASVFLTLDAHS